MSQIKKNLLLFVAITYGVGWLAIIVSAIAGLRYGDDMFQTVITVIMFLPAIAMLIARKVCGEGYDLGDVGMEPHFRGNIRRYVFTYFFPTLLVALTGLLFFAVNPSQCDLTASTLIDQLVSEDVTREVAQGAFYQRLITSVLAAPLVNSIPAFAEMLGFQGYLLPKLRSLFKEPNGLKAALACGGAWALWYLPLLACGYLFGWSYTGAPFVGILLGLAFFTLLGTVLSYFTFKTGSVFPAALARGGVTALSVTAYYFTSGEVILVTGPSVYGVFGCLALLLFTLLYMLRIRRMDTTNALYYRKPKK